MNEATKLIDYMNGITLFFQKLDQPYNPGKNEINLLIHILSGVKDFRQKNKVIYKLELILGICFYLALKGGCR